MRTTGKASEFVPRSAAALRAALIALGVLLLLSACDAFASQLRDAPSSAVSGQPGSAAGHARHHGDALSGDYCTSGAMSATVAATEWPPEAQRDALLTAALVALPYPNATIFAARPAAARYPPPIKTSFYLRSTRILR